MNKLVLRSLGVICFLFLFTLPVIAQENNQLNLTKQQQQSYYKLQASADNLYINWEKLNIAPDWIRTTNFNIKWKNSDYTERAYQFLEEYKDLYKISNPREELKLVSLDADNLGMTHVTLQQEYQNIPVYAARLKFHFKKDGSLSSATGTYLPNINTIFPSPKITEEQAFQIATAKLKKEFNLDDNSFDKISIQKSNSQLIIYNHGLFSKKQENNYLAWRFSAYSKKAAVNYLFYINAQNGEIINQMNEVKSLKNRETYTLADCLDYFGTLIYNETGLVGTYDGQAEAVHNLVSNAYDFYNNKFSRDSFDGSGGTIKSYTHYEEWDSDKLIPGCVEVENAKWTGYSLLFGENFISQDVVGHEFTHAVTNYTANFEYENESGALNESYADIFGEFIEFDNGGGDWQMGTDLPSGPSRDMSDPHSSSYRQPAHVSEQLDSTEEPCASSDDAADIGCVHYNNGIINNTLYLLTVGGTNSYSGETIDSAEAIGQDKAEQIYYRALTEYLGTASDFSDAYNATMQSCLDFYARGEHSITLADCNEVYNAFHAVGIATDPYFYSYVATPSGISGYAPLTLNFDASDYRSFGDTIATYNWNFGDGVTGSGVSVSHTYAPGTYTYTITVIDSSGDENISSGTITASNPITPTFTISGDGVAAPATVSFNAAATTDATGTITDYSWNFGDGSSISSGSTATTTHNYITGGYYNAILTVTDSNSYTNTYNKSVFVGTTGPTSVSGTIYNDTWTAARSPYVINGSVTVEGGGILTIEPGTIIKFADAASITVNGTLNAQGTTTNQIIFTSYKDDTYGSDTNGDGSATAPNPGDWATIYFNSGSDASIVSDCLIQYGGYIDSIYPWPTYSTISIASSNPTIINSTIQNSKHSIIDITSASPTIANNTISETDYTAIDIMSGSPTIDGNTISNSGSSYQAVAIASEATPAVTNNIFTNNAYPIYITGSLSAGMSLVNNIGSGNTFNAIYFFGVDTISDYTLNNDNDLPYLINYFTVSSGNTLTIDPGVVSKFTDGASITINGILNAQGTTAEPIVFTSIKDDTHGGDTNGDGSATMPAKGDWGTIYLNAGSDASIISNAVIQYGGYIGAAYPWPTYPTISINTANPTITNSTIQESKFSLINITNASPSITNNNILETDYLAIGITGGSPTIDGNTISNSGSSYQAVAIVDNATPAITNNTISNNSYGIYLTSGTPIISNNDIYNNSSYGFYNISGVNITAENNWWGDASGPYNATSNPSGTGNQASNDVDFDPWLSASINAPTDVSSLIASTDVWQRKIILYWVNPTDSDFVSVTIDRFDGATTTTLATGITGTGYPDVTPAYSTVYTYTIYTVDADGNQSPGIAISRIIQNPAPRTFVATAADTQINLTWRASTAPAAQIGGYRVYYRQAGVGAYLAVDVGNVTSHILSGLTNGTLYQVYVVAYSTAGIESPKSLTRIARPRP